MLTIIQLKKKKAIDYRKTNRKINFIKTLQNEKKFERKFRGYAEREKQNKKIM